MRIRPRSRWLPSQPSRNRTFRKCVRGRAQLDRGAATTAILKFGGPEAVNPKGEGADEKEVLFKRLVPAGSLADADRWALRHPRIYAGGAGVLAFVPFSFVTFLLNASIFFALAAAVAWAIYTGLSVRHGRGRAAIERRLKTGRS